MSTARVVIDQPPWPTVVELDPGDCALIVRGGREHRLALVSWSEQRSPDRWISDNPDRTIVTGATVAVVVDGVPATLRCRPSESPCVVGGLRVLVECTQPWATAAQLAPVGDVQRAVRLSLVGADEPWGPRWRFPLAKYAFHASSYANAWGALVPHNGLYYHRGDDFGAIPGHLPVLAVADGTLIKVPGAVPCESNGLRIDLGDGYTVRYAHMDCETVVPGLVVGERIAAGTAFACTGQTWDGRKAQHQDPHLHFGLHHGETTLATWPMLTEAWFRDHPDRVLAVAGGYAYALPGEEIDLDASRSLARPGARIVAWRWRLHDGSTVDGAQARVRCAAPGLYSEELEVVADDGSTDRDFLQVRVWDETRGRDCAWGWLHAAPARGARVGEPVLLWNRVGSLRGAEIDWGDGAREPISNQATHAYARAGGYVVTATGRGPGDEPITVRLWLRIADG